MIVPETFTLLREIAAEWPRLIKKAPPWYRGILSSVNVNSIALSTTSFNRALVLIPHKDYKRLNTELGLLRYILSTLNRRLVHQVGGVQFFHEYPAIIEYLVKEFNAEITDIHGGMIHDNEEANTIS